MPRHVDRCNHLTRERRETSAHPGWAQGSFFKFFLKGRFETHCVLSLFKVYFWAMPCPRN